MIENGSITYESVRDPFRTWQPNNQAILQILAAILATILAYQLAGITFDILVGCKHKGTTLASDISILLIAEDSTPRTILSSLGCTNFFTRRKPHHACNASSDRSTKITHFSVLLKFGVFLAAAPLANLLAIILTSEVDSSLTFADVAFGGVAVGVSADDVLVASDFDGKICRLVSTKLRNTDTADAKFFFCADSLITITNNTGLDTLFSGTSNTREPPGFTTVLRVSRNDSDENAPNNSLRLDLVNTEITGHAILYGEVLTSDGGFRLKNVMTQVEGERLLNNSVKFLSDTCRNNSRDQNSDTTGEGDIGLLELDGPDDQNWSVGSSVRCTFSNESLVFDALLEASLNVSFVETDRFEVVDVKNGNRIANIEGHLFFTRTESLVSFLVLLIVVAISLVIRIIVRAFTNNDLHVGIELLLKDTLNVPPYDSMLSLEDVIDYKHKVYDGQKMADEDSCDCV